MAETIVQVNSGSGPKLHGWDRTIGANLVVDQFVLPGEYPLPSYFMFANGASIAVANDHILQIMAGASLNVRIRSILVTQGSNATAAALASLNLYRLTSAGTGGTVITAAKFNTGDAAAGATGMSIPTAKGAESTLLMGESTNVQQTTPASPGATRKILFEWRQRPGVGPIIIPAGVTNGIALKSLTAIAAANVNVTVEFVETSF